MLRAVSDSAWAFSGEEQKYGSHSPGKVAEDIQTDMTRDEKWGTKEANRSTMNSTSWNRALDLRFFKAEHTQLPSANDLTFQLSNYK